MKRADRFSFVLITVGTEKNAAEIARALVSSGLAACVNIIPNVRSIYRWKDKICDEKEWLCIVKTRGAHLSKVEKLVKKTHTYDVPEIVSIPLHNSSASYLAWLSQQTISKKRRIA